MQIHSISFSSRLGAQRRRLNRITRLLGTAVLPLLMTVFAAADEAAPTDEQLRFFEERIRPALIEHCYECHSEAAANAGKLRGQLKLDSRPASLRGGESGAAVVPGKPLESLLLSAMRYEDFQMPPKGKLPDQVLKDFELWISRGAADPRTEELPTKPVQSIDYEAGRNFWSFQQLARPPIPQVAETPNPIDAFIVAQQAKVGVEMSPMTSARILVRRAWFDLLGIPPTPDEMRLWVDRLTRRSNLIGGDGEIADSINMEAWSELVSQLLDRPQYGERWARHWMDVARFAESYGYEQDYDRPHAYHYRDFLIRAFNDDMPYQQFVQWQIAGDEIAPQNPQAWMATGFLSAGAFPTQLTEAEFESARYDELDDMVSTTAQAFLGLSIGCARCHDHKFDPISAEDYYGLLSVFGTAIRCESKFELDPARSQQVISEYQQRLATARQSLADYEAGGLKDEFREWLRSTAAENPPVDPWERLDGQLTSSAGSRYQPLTDGSFLCEGKAPNNDVLTFRSHDIKLPVRSIRIEALSDPSLPGAGPGRAGNGNFALGDLRLRWFPTGQPAINLQLRSARATHQQNESSLSIVASIDNDPITGWAVDGQIGRSQAAIVDLTQSLDGEQSGQLEVMLAFNHPNPHHIIGRLRLSITSSEGLPLGVGSEGLSGRAYTAIQGLRKMTDLPPAEADSLANENWNIALKWFREQSAKYKELKTVVAALEKQGPTDTMQSVQVTSEGLPILNHHANDRGFPHFYPQTYLLRRGDVHQRVRVAEPAVPRVLKRRGEAKLVATQAVDSANPRSSYRRASLAQWLTDTDEGAGALVARVIVNRLWQHHFGLGIVATPNDFGATGDRPANPELLEWLACQLVDGQWKLKALHHSIMTSKTYMQAGCKPADPRAEVDPANKLLWHRAPMRLEAEAIRDSMLSVSGLLDTKMYGPGSLDPLMRRRSVYFFIKRSQLVQPMILLDWPEHLVSIGRRQVTTIAPQSLQFMNADWVRACAVGLATRAVQSSQESLIGQPLKMEAAIREIHRLALGREISDRELSAAQDFMNSLPMAKPSETVGSISISALTDYCHAVLSLNEFIYVD